MRNTSSKSEAAPWSGDPADNAAMRAQKILSNSHDVGAAARALRAPKNPTRMSPGQLTQTFRNLNPQTGDPAPVIPPNPGVGQGGGDDPSYHTERQQHFPRGSININSFDEPATVRRTLAPPAELKTPKSISFTTAQIIRRIRRASTASAGGLSGTTYRVLRHWFHDHDETSDDLTCVINLIAAGNVPRTLIPLLTAGRGIAIPKNENGDLRPIVIGHVILRLIGSLSVTSLSDDIQRFFLLPNAMQFGVGVAGGCEIMVAAISTHLENFPEHIDVAGDARNAFNSWCRSKYGTNCTRIFLRYMPLLSSSTEMRQTYSSPSSTLKPQPYGIRWVRDKAAVSGLSYTAWRSMVFCFRCSMSSQTY